MATTVFRFGLGLDFKPLLFFSVIVTYHFFCLGFLTQDWKIMALFDRIDSELGHHRT